MIGIVCDSGTDLPEELKNKKNVRVVPLRVVLDDKSYRDGVEITEEELLNYMEEKIPKTSLPPQSEIEAAFVSLIEKGYNEIISINISSGLSGTYNLSRIAAESVMQKYPVKIAAIDSRSISIGSGLLIYKALEMVEKKKMTFEQIVDELKKVLKDRIRVYFAIPTLKFLKAGGRIGRVSATVGEFLKIKPVISVDKGGEYYTVAKARGMNRAVKLLIEKVINFVFNKSIEAIAVYTSGDDPAARKYAELIRKKLGELKPKMVLTGKLSSAMLVHVGNGLIGVAVLIGQ